MGFLDSIRGLAWARRRQPDQVRYFVELAHERFTPDDLLRQGIEAEKAGFDGLACSDHTAPWWEPGAPAPAACGNAWVWLGAVGQATNGIPIGTGVTSLLHRYNPLVVAQQVATLEAMFPGRAFLGVGSGEAMNEVPAGMEYPNRTEQLQRTEEGLGIVKRLLDGETVTFEGDYFRVKKARLYTIPSRRPPIYMSAFYEGAAEVAGRLADGVWTLGDPQKAPSVIQAYRRGAAQAGREPGEVILQAVFSWATDDDTAFESAREWKGTMVDANYTEPIADPAEIYRRAEQEVSDKQFKAQVIASSDPSTHVKRIKTIQALGASTVVLMNVSGADPHRALEVYGDQVLPELRG